METGINHFSILDKKELAEEVQCSQDSEMKDVQEEAKEQPESGVDDPNKELTGEELDAQLAASLQEEANQEPESQGEAVTKYVKQNEVAQLTGMGFS